MLRNSLTGLDRKQLRRWLVLFFVALAIPAGVLIYQAYSQLKWEALHVHSTQAEELAGRIDKAFSQLISAEEARTFTDYAFLNVAGDPSANFLQRSPLSTFPLDSPIPGLIGYFQIDTDGTFSTPLVPQPGTQEGSYGISATELEQRQAMQDTLRQILSRNRLVQSGKPSPAATRVDEQAVLHESSTPEDKDVPERLADDVTMLPAETTELQLQSQAAFDQLNKASGSREKKQKAARLGRVEDLKLDYSYQQAGPADEEQAKTIGLSAPVIEKRARKERSVLPASIAPSPASIEAEVSAQGQDRFRIQTFESEIDPLEFSQLDSGQFVLYRKVWRDGQRYIQGMLIEQTSFLNNLIETAYRSTALSDMSKLIVAYQGNVVSAFGDSKSRSYLSSAEELQGAVLYQTRLSDPLGELELIFSVTRLPAGPGGAVVAWLAMILVLVLCGGFYLMYRLGVRQIDLARQQQDFVSAVSHELKTPLTSIRMYGEMLREGWAPEDKKQGYYDYIHDESERLSRLIGNVLQLARMTRNDLQVDLKRIKVTELMDGIHSRVAAQIERAGFELNLSCDDAAGKASVEVDSDWFTQIIINLIDNAIKFSVNAERKTIDVECRLMRGDSVQFSVRDYGPGIPRNQMKKIFKLFYRSGNELTRETVGTGIGLALVNQLAQAMNGTVDVDSRDPGVEFRFSLKESKNV